MPAYTPGHEENFSTDSSGRILIKKAGRLERDTYELLTKSSVERDLFEGLIPKVTKITARTAEEGSNKEWFDLEMENLTNGMEDIAMVDLKLGKWLYNPGHPDYNVLTGRIEHVLRDDPQALTTAERRDKKWLKSRQMEWRMKNTLFGTEYFGVNGFKHSKIKAKYEEYDRHHFNSQITASFLQDFFTGFDNVKHYAINQIAKIKEAITKSSLCKHRTLFHASLFFAFDLNNPEKHEVRLIDFGRSYPNDQVKKEVQNEQFQSILKAFDNIIDSITKIEKSRTKIKPMVKVDFDQVENEYRKMEEEMANKDVNIFFEQIFAKSSPEVQMAMKKSFTESNGTVLSTDWSDVGSKDVKPYKSEEGQQ